MIEAGFGVGLRFGGGALGRVRAGWEENGRRVIFFAIKKHIYLTFTGCHLTQINVDHIKRTHEDFFFVKFLSP